LMAMLLTACAGIIPGPSAAGPTATSAPAATVTVEPPAAPTVASPAELGPAETVAAFYAWLIAYTTGGAEGPRNPLVDGAYRDTGYVSAEMAQRVRAASDGQGGFDPFLCAQDVPAEVLPVEVRESGDDAAVDARTSFEGHRFTVALRRHGTGWQIVNVICNAGEASPDPTPATVTATVQVQPASTGGESPSLPVGWQLYRNETYRFQIGYPAGWVTRETAAAEGQPPIGPENTRLIVMLMPGEWAKQLDEGGAPGADAPVLAPFTLDVTLGSEQEFWENYPQPLDRDEAQLPNASAIRAVEVVTDEISLPHLIFQHPVAKDLRVALTDPINGFADRKAAHPEVAATFEKMANTFAWLD
jgi:hypothetical protein